MVESKRPEGETSPSRLERLREELYARKPAGQQKPPLDLRRKPPPVDSSWGEEGTSLLKTYVPPARRPPSIFSRLFLASIVFFLAALGVTLYTFFGGENLITTQNVDITFVGAVSVAGGSPFSLEVTVHNQNNVPLEIADLLVEFPEGARKAENVTEEIRRHREELGSIPPGGTVVRKVSATVFGEEGEKKEVRVTVEYRVRGSNAILQKTKPYEMFISTAPVSFVASMPREVNVNQTVEMTLEITSNATTVIEDVVLESEHPFGFTLADASPKPAFGNNFWSLGDLPPGGRRVIALRGTFEGQDGEERSFRFTVGTVHPKDERSLGTPLLKSTRSLVLHKPFIGIEAAIDGDTGKEYVVETGRTVRVDVLWTNNVPAKIADVTIEAKLIGTAFEESSVTAEEGLYHSLDHTISWSQREFPELALLEPGAAGRTGFSFTLRRPSADLTTPYLPSLELVLTARGRRLGDGEVAQEITSTVTKTIKAASSLTLASRVLYSIGSFKNRGSLPPSFGKETTYTVVWSLSNTLNDVSNTRVIATIPSYVSWIGIWNPAEEKISYNPIGGEIVWEVGNLKAGAGIRGGAREISFQISFVPSESQIGTAPVLIGETIAEAEDQFTGTLVRSISRPPLSTRLFTDPNFRSGDDIVTR